MAAHVECVDGMRRNLVVFSMCGLLVAGPCIGRAAASAEASSYPARFRGAYMPIFRGLNQAPACAAVNRVGQLPACAQQVARFRLAVARFLQFLTHAPPPAKAKADIRELISATRVLQQTFTTVAGIIKRKDIARLKAIGGLGHPTDRAIQEFLSAIGVLALEVPALKVPLPG